MNDVTIWRKIGPDLYREFLDLVATTAKTFHLVSRDDVKLNANGLAFKRELEPFKKSEQRSSEWLGTTVFPPNAATIRSYRLNAQTSQLLRVADDLFDWVGPDLPEDLAFFGTKGEVLYHSIAHERLGFLTCSALPEHLVRPFVNRLIAQGHIEEALNR